MMDYVALFDEVIDNPSSFLMTVDDVDRYKDALQALKEEGHANPYGYIIQLITTEVQKRASDLLFECTEFAADNIDKIEKRCMHCDTRVQDHGKTCSQKSVGH
jgi:hypothetical protein